MILPNKKIIFIHIPKTGGVSIERALCPEWGFVDYGWKDGRGYQQHSTIGQLLSYGFITEEQANTYFVFTFVRNPWDRMVSLYFFLNKLPKYEIQMRGVSFNKFIEKILEFRNGERSEWKDDLEIIAMIKNQAEYIPSGKVDFIGRFENLYSDMDKLFVLLKLEKRKLEKINQTIHKHYSDYYDEKTKELVTRIFKEDVDLFEYKFKKKPVFYNLSYYYIPTMLNKGYKFSARLRGKSLLYSKVLDVIKKFF